MATNKSTTLLDVFEKNKYDLATAAKRSNTWFQQEVLLLSKQRVTPKRILTGNTEQITGRILPGKLYMFAYDAKLKEKLEYYDQFPLVLPFRKLPDGFIGLNLHYLPYRMRAVLLDRLMIYASNSRMDETTRLKFSWQLIDGVSRYKAAQPCVKRYLNQHIHSQFRQIMPRDWGTALMLPVERFIGASVNEVWADSTRKAR